MDCPNIASCELLKFKSDLGLEYGAEEKDEFFLARNYFHGLEPLLLVRSSDSIGSLYFRDIFICDTLEHPNYLIDEGFYKLRLTYSPKFKSDRYEIFDVPGRSRLLIHEGCYIKDSKGCVLVGVANANNTLSYSQITLKRVMRIIKDCSILFIKISSNA